jgi:hypothetical protein
MTAFLILSIIVGIACGFSSWAKKAEYNNTRKANRGSIAVEAEEYDRLSRILFDEYKELTGYDIEYPEMIVDRSSINTLHGTYEKSFSNMVVKNNIKIYANLEALEKLRKNHNLPSNAEWAAQGYVLVSNPLHNCYTELYTVIHWCVKAAVTARGFKFAGIDYDAEEAQRLTKKYIETKYPWM